MKKICDSCGKENHERAKFCTSCGKSLPAGGPSPVVAPPLQQEQPSMSGARPTPMRAPKPILNQEAKPAAPSHNAPTMFAAEGVAPVPARGATPAPFPVVKEAPVAANVPTMFAGADANTGARNTSSGLAAFNKPDPQPQVKLGEKLVVRGSTPTKAPKPTPQPGAFDPQAATPPMPAPAPLRPAPLRNDPAAMTLPASDASAPANMSTLPAPDEMDSEGDKVSTMYDPSIANAPMARPVAAPASAPADGSTPCPNCTTPIPAGFIFCGRCGFDMRTYTPPAPPVDDVPTPPSQKGPVPDLVLLTPDGQEYNRFPLAFGDVTVGRGSNADISCPDNFFLSEHHGIFSWDGQRLILRDLGSFNGTFIKLKSEIPLVNGDYLCIGQQFLRFELCEIVPSPSQASDGTFRHGAPLPDLGARLVLVGMGGLDFDVFYLRNEETTIGRVNGDIIFAKDNFISRAHAKIVARDGTFTLADLNSSNGTFLQIREETELVHSELLLMGDQLFRVELPRE